jgi:hypothetical protein
MAINYETFNLCVGEQAVELFPDFDPEVLEYGNFEGLPEWVTLTYSGEYVNGFIINPPYEGTYQFTFDTQNGETIEYEVEINISNCNQVAYDNCCDNQCNIAWLNLQGGWQNYIFTGIKTFEVDQDNGNTFKTLNKTIKWSERKEVYNAVVCTTGSIPKAHVDYLDSLRYSIQAFLYNSTTNAFDIPILIDSDSFVKYTSRQKLFDVSIRFLRAKEIQVQRQ